LDGGAAYGILHHIKVLLEGTFKLVIGYRVVGPQTLCYPSFGKEGNKLSIGPILGYLAVTVSTVLVVDGIRSQGFDIERKMLIADTSVGV